MLDIREEKRLLRKKYSALRDKLTKQEIAENSKKIWEYFLSEELYHHAERIIFYLNFRSEVETLPYLEQVFRDKKHVMVPYCITAEHQMEIYEITDTSQLRPGAYGILEPDIKQASFISEQNEADIILVPALAFDKSGYRLGYGAGYYDRFLDGNSISAVGFAFSCCVCESLPHEQKDKSVNYLITENGCTWI